MTSVEPRSKRDWPAYSSACRQSIIGCSLLGTPAEATWRGVSQLQDFQPIFPKVSGSLPLGMQSPVTQRTTALGVGKLQAFQPIEGTRQSPEYPVVAASRSHLLSTEVGWAAAAVLREYLQPPRNKVKLARGRREAGAYKTNLFYSAPLRSALRMIGARGCTLASLCRRRRVGVVPYTAVAHADAALAAARA